MLESITSAQGRPQTITFENGSEFISKAMDKWAHENGVELDFARRSKPTDNAKIELFNGGLRQECLNKHWFLSLVDAQCKIEARRRHYNETRLHSALNWLTPKDFSSQEQKREELKLHK